MTAKKGGGRESGGVSREDNRGDTSPSGPKSPAAANPAVALRGHRAGCEWDELGRCSCDNPFILDKKFVSINDYVRELRDEIDGLRTAHAISEARNQQAGRWRVGRNEYVDVKELIPKLMERSARLEQLVREVGGLCARKDLYGKDVNPARILGIIEKAGFKEVVTHGKSRVEEPGPANP